LTKRRGFSLKTRDASPEVDKPKQVVLSFEEQKEKEAESKEIIKKFQEERKAREQAKRKKEKERMEKLAHESEEMTAKNAEDKELELQKKLDKIAENKEKIRERAEERKKMEELSRLEVKKVMKTKPMYEILQEKFEVEVDAPSLEQRKQQLKDIRNFYKPLQRDDFTERGRSYDLTKKEIEMNIKMKRDQDKQTLKEHMKNNIK